MRIGFVGLGVMGAPMAGHLVATGRDVLVWNRTAGKSAPLASAGAHVASSLPELASVCGIIFTCVGKTEDVVSCLHAMTPHAVPGTLFVDHSTISPTGAIEIEANLRSGGFRFVDAPITGGSGGALNGTLTIFCGGSEADVEEVIPVVSAYAKRAERTGGPGSGQMTKLANQIAVGGALLALCECLSFAKKAGLDVSLTRDLIAGGAGGSWAFENYGPKILAEDWTPGFSVKNQRKDLGYCAEAAQKLDASIPGSLLVNRLLSVLEEEGHGEWTTAALYQVLLQKGWSDGL